VGCWTMWGWRWTYYQEWSPRYWWGNWTGYDG